MAGGGNMLYNAIFKRTSTLILTILVGSVVFERCYEMMSVSIYERYNKGKLWKDIKAKYE